MTQHSVSERLGSLMARKKLTVSALAELSGVPELTIKSILNGRILEPPAYVLSALARALGAETIYLAKGVEPSLDQTVSADPDAQDYESADHLVHFYHGHHMHWHDLRKLWTFAMRAHGAMDYARWGEAFRHCFGRPAGPRQALLFAPTPPPPRNGWSCSRCGYHAESEPARCPECGLCCD